MILKLTKVDDDADDLEAGDCLLVNLDQVAAVHNQKIVRKLPIVGQQNEFIGSIVTMASGRAFPVREKAETIYEMLPYPLTRVPLKGTAGESQII